MGHVDLCARGYKLSAMPSIQSLHYSCARQRLSGSKRDRLVSIKIFPNATSNPLLSRRAFLFNAAVLCVLFERSEKKSFVITALGPLRTIRNFYANVIGFDFGSYSPACYSYVYLPLSALRWSLLPVRRFGEFQSPLGRGPTGRTPHC